ncbi:MAG: hypothetical protein WBK55_01290 [Alphaproteobacteria bacterium]
MESLFMSAATYIIVGDAYERAMSKHLGEPGRHEFNVLSNGVARIEQAINAQNSAHFTAAKMALARNEIPLALDKLESGLAVDPINAKGWLLYADLLMSQNHRDLAAQVVAQCAEWFGPHCPALPEEVRNIYLSQDKVQGNIKATVHNPENKNWWLYCFGLSKRGAAFVFERDKFFGEGRKVRIVFAPALKYEGIDTRHLKNDSKIVFPKPVTIFSDDYWPTDVSWHPRVPLEKRGDFSHGNYAFVAAGPVIRTFTDRFAVTGRNVVIDLMEDFRQIHLPASRIEENFGSERYGCGENIWEDDPILIRGVPMQRDYTEDDGCRFYKGTINLEI